MNSESIDYPAYESRALWQFVESVYGVLYGWTTFTMTALVDVGHDVLAHGRYVCLVRKDVQLEKSLIIKVLRKSSSIQPSDEPFGLRCIELKSDAVLSSFGKVASQECSVVA